MENQVLIPELIKDLVKKYETATNQNEFFVMQDRLKAISNYLNKTLAARHKYSRIK